MSGAYIMLQVYISLLYLQVTMSHSFKGGGHEKSCLNRGGEEVQKVSNDFSVFFRPPFINDQ